MKWADRAKKILENPKARTDITDIRVAKGTSVGSVGATWKAFSEKNGDAGTETPILLEPLPGRHFIDPMEHHYLTSAKTMADLSECRGYPQACQRCRALMADLETCLLGPEGGAS